MTVAGALASVKLAHGLLPYSPIDGVSDTCYNLLRGLVAHPDRVDAECEQKPDKAVCKATKFKFYADNLPPVLKKTYDTCVAANTGGAADYCMSAIDWKVEGLSDKLKAAGCDEVCKARLRMETFAALKPDVPKDEAILASYHACKRMFKSGASDWCETIVDEALTDAGCTNCNDKLPRPGKVVEKWLEAHTDAMSPETQATFKKCQAEHSSDSFACYKLNFAQWEAKHAADCKGAKDGGDNKAACVYEKWSSSSNYGDTIELESCRKVLPVGLPGACSGIVEHASQEDLKEAEERCNGDANCLELAQTFAYPKLDMKIQGYLHGCQKAFDGSIITVSCAAAMKTAMTPQALTALDSAITAAGANCHADCKYKMFVEAFVKTVTDNDKLKEAIDKCDKPENTQVWYYTGPLGTR